MAKEHFHQQLGSDSDQAAQVDFILEAIATLDRELGGDRRREYTLARIKRTSRRKRLSVVETSALASADYAPSERQS